MLQAAPPSRAKTALVVTMILLPLALIAVVKYMPAVTGHQRISNVAIAHPRLFAPEEYRYLHEDLMKRLHDELSEINGIRLREAPAESETEIGDDLKNAADQVGADALIMTSVTIDAGLVQLNVQLVVPATKQILYNTPYQSSLDRYPGMVHAAAAGLKRALEP